MVDNLLLAGFNSKGYLSNHTYELHRVNLMTRKMINNKLADFLTVISYGQMRNMQTNGATKSAQSHSRKSKKVEKQRSKRKKKPNSPDGRKKNEAGDPKKRPNHKIKEPKNEDKPWWATPNRGWGDHPRPLKVERGGNPTTKTKRQKLTEVKPRCQPSRRTVSKALVLPGEQKPQNLRKPGVGIHTGAHTRLEDVTTLTTRARI